MPETKPAKISVKNFIENLPTKKRREEATVLVGIFEGITKHPATMWGPTIIGFDTYHYKYASGHEGDMAVVSFSPRKGALVLYLYGDYPEFENQLARLGKHKKSKACIYINKLEDIDTVVLKQMVKASYIAMDSHPDRVMC